MPERSFGRTIRSRRTSLGLSQTKLGELVGRSSATIRSWEQDSSHPVDAAVVTALSAVLGIDERTLYERAGIEMPEVETSPTVEQALASLAPDSQDTADTAGLITNPEPDRKPAAATAGSVETYVLTTVFNPGGEASYLEDPAQRRLYQGRTIATVVILAGLAIALVWAVSQGLGSLGAWWDDFFGSLRL